MLVAHSAWPLGSSSGLTHTSTSLMESIPNMNMNGRNHNTNMNTHMNMNMHNMVFSPVPLRSGSSFSGQDEEEIRKKQMPQKPNKK